MRLLRSKGFEVVGLCVALAIYCDMATRAASRKSATFDEHVHVTAGYTYWTQNDYRLNPENGNWTQRLLALPLLLDRPAFPTLDQDAWRRSDMWDLSDQFFYAPGARPAAMLAAARAVVTLMAAALGLIVFCWSRRLFGIAGGWTSLIVFVFSPTMLAHGALATSDVIGAAFFTAAAWALWTVLHRLSPGTMAVSVLATSGLFLAKLSAVLFIPCVAVLIAIRLIVGRPLEVRLPRWSAIVTGRSRQAGIIAAVAGAHVALGLLIVWVSYGFRYEAFTHATAADQFIDPWGDVLDGGAVSAVLLFARAHRLLPEAYLYGVASVAAYSKHRVSFLNGTIATGGAAAWFFPYAALVKTTLPALILLAAAPFVFFRTRRSRLYDLAPLLCLIAVYGVFAIRSDLNIGHRHLLPIIPAAIILLGANGPLLAKPLRGGAAVALCLVAHAATSLRVAPDYLAYFNAFAGGPDHAYRHLVDSSLDWGQDLPALKEWLDAHGQQGANHGPVYLSYFGTARPEYYGIDARHLPGFADRPTGDAPQPLSAGVYCISATMLQGLYLDFKGPWSSEYEAKYQAARHDLDLLASTSSHRAAREALIRQTGTEYWHHGFRMWEQLRFSRLLARVRQMEPIAMVGHSILIYRLTDQDIRAALLDPPPSP